jgi:hypothetical protein
MAITSIKTGSSFTNLIKYNDFLAGNTAFQPTAYESIATVTVGSGGSSTITFSSIPSTYQHLQIRGIARSTQAATDFSVQMYFNAISTQSGNYAAHALRGNGSSASAFGGSTEWIQLPNAAANATSSVFGVSVWDILDYTSTNKNKVVRGLGGYDNNGGGIVQFSSGMLHSSQPVISSITLFTSGGDFAQYTKFGLFGIKGA